MINEVGDKCTLDIVGAEIKETICHLITIKQIYINVIRKIL